MTSVCGGWCSRQLDWVVALRLDRCRDWEGPRPRLCFTTTIIIRLVLALQCPSRTHRPRRIFRRALEFGHLLAQPENESAGAAVAPPAFFRKQDPGELLVDRDAIERNDELNARICLECMRMSFVMKRSTPAVAAQASWIVSGGRSERSALKRA